MTMSTNTEDTATSASSIVPKRRVAMIQDLQLPRVLPQEAATLALAKLNLEPIWPPFEDDTKTDAWALITDGRGKVTDGDLQKHPHAKFLFVAFVGTNHIDLDACRRRGITVVNTPDYSSHTVAELTIGMALSVYRDLPRATESLRRYGNDCHCHFGRFGGGMELYKKTVGIVGIGSIGLCQAKLFKAFGCRMIGWSRRPKPEFTADPAVGGTIGGEQVSSLEELFDRADIVVLSLGLNDQTRGIISRELMKRLQPNDVLINIARSQLVDHEAMIELLKNRRFRAALDVYPLEPVLKDDPLLMDVPKEQVVLLPHIGYKSVEALERRLDMLLENVSNTLKGNPRNVVS